MAEWTEARKKEVVEKYLASGPTESNSVELVKEIADDMEESANGVRMILMQEKVYIKKGTATETKAKTGGTKTTGDKAPRATKDTQIAALKQAIEDAGKVADDEILSKLTGKAAVYFLSIIAEAE